MFMCKNHWYRVPALLRRAVWKEYRPGQESDKRPSNRYMAVQRRAIAEVAFKPHDEEAALVCANYIVESETWRSRAVEAGEGDPLAGLVKNEPCV